MIDRSAPIAEISAELAGIAARPGWHVLAAWRDTDQSGAAIAKDGVVLRHSRFRAERDDIVRLECPVHPPVVLNRYRDPTIADILDGIGIIAAADATFVAIADHLPAVTRFLSDPAIFQARVMAQAGDINRSYIEHINGGPAAASLAPILVARHPWLADGPLPSFDALLQAPAAPDASRARRQSQVRLAVILSATAIGLAIARWLHA